MNDQEDQFPFWPFCTVEGCKNKAYLKGESDMCFPHTKEADDNDSRLDAQSESRALNGPWASGGGR